MLIEIEFTAFETEIDYYYDYSEMEYDYDKKWCYSYRDHLRIEDGDGTSLMDRTCGSSDSYIIIGDYGQSIGANLPPNILSTSNVVKFIFVSDPLDADDYNSISGSRGGWSVSWRAVSPPGECQHQP